MYGDQDEDSDEVWHWHCRHCGAYFDAEVCPDFSGGVSFCVVCGADDVSPTDED